jgi:hypothetical protein
MANSERIAVAAHLHVALRRKAGRVTDTDWMAENDEYAQAIIRFAQSKAIEDADESLSALANKLEALLHTKSPRKNVTTPLLQRIPQNLQPSLSPETASTHIDTLTTEEAPNRYIGGLR